MATYEENRAVVFEFLATLIEMGYNTLGLVQDEKAKGKVLAYNLARVAKSFGAGLKSEVFALVGPLLAAATTGKAPNLQLMTSFDGAPDGVSIPSAGECPRCHSSLVVEDECHVCHWAKRPKKGNS